MTKPKRDITRLPQWAQEYIGQLERKWSEAADRLAAIERKQVTDISYGYGMHGDEMGYLPPGERFVTFHIRREKYPQRDTDFIRVTHRCDRVEVHGSEAVDISPGASNTMTVQLRDISR